MVEPLIRLRQLISTLHSCHIGPHAFSYSTQGTLAYTWSWTSSDKRPIYYISRTNPWAKDIGQAKLANHHYGSSPLILSSMLINHTCNWYPNYLTQTSIPHLIVLTPYTIYRLPHSSIRLAQISSTSASNCSFDNPISLQSILLDVSIYQPHLSLLPSLSESPYYNFYTMLAVLRGYYTCTHIYTCPASTCH